MNLLDAEPHLRGPQLQQILLFHRQRTPPEPEQADSETRADFWDGLTGERRDLAASDIELVGEREADRLVGGRLDRRWPIERLERAHAALLAGRMEDDLVARMEAPALHG